MRLSIECAREAVENARSMTLSSTGNCGGDTRFSSRCARHFVVHDSGTGCIHVMASGMNRRSFTPTSDGRPRFRTFAPSAQHAGRSLALFADKPRVWSIHDLDNDGKTLVEYPPSRLGVAKLSNDGRLFVATPRLVN